MGYPPLQSRYNQFDRHIIGYPEYYNLTTEELLQARIRYSPLAFQVGLASGFKGVTILVVDRHQHLPDKEKLSILAATILLAYSLSRFITIPERAILLQLFGLLIPITLNTRTVIIILVAGITASGTEWLLQSHPVAMNHKTYQHWFVPAFTSWVVGFPIIQLPFGVTWIASFFIGGVVLILVLVAEYITLDPSDIRQPVAASGLITVSFAIYLTFTIALHYLGFRLILLLPSIMLASMLVSLRAFQLRLYGRWAFFEAGTIALISVQIASALHYWPISSLSFGLALLGPTYSLTSFINNMAEGEPISQAVIEPAIILLIVWGIAYWYR